MSRNHGDTDLSCKKEGCLTFKTFPSLIGYKGRGTNHGTHNVRDK